MSEADRDAASCPQRTNRGAENPLVFSVDWLEPSLWEVELREVERVVSGYIGFDFTTAERGNSYYENQRIAPGGAAIMWSAHRPEIHVQLKGDICQSMEEAQMRGLLGWLDAKGAKASRIDLAADDFNKIVRAKDVWEALDRGDWSSHILEGNWTRDETLHGGMTVYGGGKGSRQKLRVYDKDEQSGGLIPATRWELQVRDDAAERMLKRLVLERWGKVWAERLLQMVEFVDRTVDEKPRRCPRLGWFEALVGSAEKEQGVYAPKPLPTLEQRRKWFKTTCGPTAAMIVKDDGGDIGFLLETVKSGESRLKSKHRTMLEGAAKGREAEPGKVPAVRSWATRSPN